MLLDFSVAAHGGRIDTLLIDPRAEVFGSFDTESSTLKIASKRVPALDLAELAIV
jgi:hypothetical protein